MVVVLQERRELAPPCGSAQQQGLTLDDPAERHPHGQPDDVDVGGHLAERRQPGHATGAFASRARDSSSQRMAGVAVTPCRTTEIRMAKATVDQMSKDVAAFLTWTAEPKKVKRTQVGWPVIGFLLFAPILAWMAKNQVWAAIKPKKGRAA